MSTATLAWKKNRLKNTCLTIFRTLRDKLTAFWRKFFQPGGQNCIFLLPKVHYVEKYTKRKICCFLIFEHWAKKNQLFDEIILAWLSKLHTKYPEEFNNEIFFRKRKFVPLFSYLQRKDFCPFGEKFSGRIVKTAFNVSRKSLWGKYFSKKKRKFFKSFRNLGKKFSAIWPKFFFGSVVKIAITCPEEHREEFSERNYLCCFKTLTETK